MKLWRWENGRQSGSPYRKLPLAWSSLFRFDCYIIVIPAGSFVGRHTDPTVPGYEHHRINVTLRRPAIGGKTSFNKGGYALWEDQPARCYRFRPDLIEHCVSQCAGGSLVLFSFGWLRKAS